ncbi:MAG: anti-sigma factor family protein [Phycisphaerae bacterium]
MSFSADSGFDPKLLDLHLGRLCEHEQAALEQRIGSDPGLRAQNEALATMFEALGSVREPGPGVPAGLVEKISARVAGAGSPPRLVRPPRTAAAELAEVEDARVIRLHNFREIAAVAAMIVLAVGLGVPSMLHMRERGQRFACATHLANIGRGMQAYAMANHDSLPFAGWSANSSWRPTVEPGVEVRPNRRHVYVLLRNGHVPARIFICPSASDLPMPEDQVPYHNNFLESRNLSYAYQNMAGVRPSLRDNPDLPVLGDDNPFFDNGWPLFAVMRSLGLSDPAKTNSRVHGGAGQNILTIRGNVKWMTTPNCGLGGDNIWTIQGVNEYTGREGPQSTTDSHLLK